MKPTGLKRTNIYLSARQQFELKQIATLRGVSLAEVIRGALDDWIEAYRGKQPVEYIIDRGNSGIQHKPFETDVIERLQLLESIMDEVRNRAVLERQSPVEADRSPVARSVDADQNKHRESSPGNA